MYFPLPIWISISILSVSECSVVPEYRVGVVLPLDHKNGGIDLGYSLGIRSINQNSTQHPFRLTPVHLYVKDGDSFRASKELCNSILSKGVVAILGGASNRDPSLEWKLFWTAAALDVPLFFSTPSYSHTKNSKKANNNEFALRLSPSLEAWSTLLRQLCTWLRLQGVAILYEDERGLMRTQGLLREPSPVEHIIVRRVEGLEDYTSVLKDVKSREIRHLIIDCKVTSLEKLLESIVELHMTDYKYHYILTNLDVRTADMSPFIKANVNLTSFQMVNPEAKLVQEWISANSLLNGTRSGNNETILSETALAYDSVTALVQGILGMTQGGTPLTPANLSCSHYHHDNPWKDGLSLLNYITSSEFRGLSGPVSFKEGARLNPKLDIIRLTSTGWKKVGYFSSVLNITKPKTFFDAGLTNATLIVTCVIEAPYVQLRHNAGNLTGNARYEGFSVDLLKLISNMVGFSYILEPVPDGKYGAYDSETGEWNGVIRQLTDKTVDLAIGALTITHAREMIIDFTKPFMHFGISILFRKPARQQTGVFAFLKPLALEIWLSVGISYLLVSLTIFAVARFSPYEWSSSTTAMSSWGGSGLPKRGKKRNQFTLSNALWYPIGTLMQQGSDLNPKTTSTRIVGGIWWFFSIVIVSSYTANLAAFLTVQRLRNPIENAKDLVEQNEVAYGTLESGSTMAFFRDSQIELYQKMWRFMGSRKPSVFTQTYKEGISRVLKGNYAFLMESTSIAYVTAQNCNLTQIGDLLNSKGYGIALPKGSPWKDKISLAILELQEIGVIRWYQDKWWSRRSIPEADPRTGDGDDDISDANDEYCASAAELNLKKSSKDAVTASALGVDSIGGVFLVLLIGLGIAVSVSLIEFCWNSKTQRDEEELKTNILTELKDEAKFAVSSCGGTPSSNTRPEKIKSVCQSCQEMNLNVNLRIPTPPPPPTGNRNKPPCMHNHEDEIEPELVEFAFSPAYDGGDDEDERLLFHHHHYPSQIVGKEHFGIRNRSHSHGCSNNRDSICSSSDTTSNTIHTLNGNGHPLGIGY